ncbi:hypothetical protein PInf_010171 [Phytophthora infestans]|nr:hypothetical protein PInf_010128 [Phytophthora infestans]KAI9980838.1 hypothetical protein PInf_010171 [Phytophthora infestans]
MDDDFMGARSARCQRSYVCADDYDYNFVIPKHLVNKLDAVVEAEKMKRKKSSYFGNDSEADHPEGTTNEIIAFFPGGTPKFTSAAKVAPIGLIAAERSKAAQIGNFCNPMGPPQPQSANLPCE